MEEKRKADCNVSLSYWDCKCVVSAEIVILFVISLNIQVQMWSSCVFWGCTAALPSRAWPIPAIQDIDWAWWRETSSSSLTQGCKVTWEQSKPVWYVKCSFLLFLFEEHVSWECFYINSIAINTEINILFPVFQPEEEKISGTRESVFEFEDLQLLPLRDVAILGGEDFTHQFGFTVGPVCFS